MEQRPLRLGDIVDDYCPRERRITNHTIVALVGDDIRQTRCSTCDGEHVYKDGKEPRRRKKDADDKGTDGAGGQLISARAPSSDVESPEPAAAASAHETDTPAPSLSADEPPADAGGWFGHRRLIRATLPRTEGDLPAPRPIPEFTMHQRPQSRGGRPFRDPQHGGGWSGGGGGRSNGDGNGNGFRHGRPGNGDGSGSFDGRGGQRKSGHHRSRHKRPR